MHSLKNRQQREDEDTEDFILQMYRLCKDCDMSEKTVTAFIMESLRPEVQFAMKLKEPTTVAEMVTIARTVPSGLLKGRDDRLEQKVDHLISAVPEDHRNHRGSITIKANEIRDHPILECRQGHQDNCTICSKM